MRPPSPNPPAESKRSIAASALKFAGMLLTCGGALAVMRLRGTDQQAHAWFFGLFMPIGMAVWFIGFRLGLSRPRPEGDARG